MKNDVVNATITPRGYLDILSKSEICQLLNNSYGAYTIFRNCCLAVLSSSSGIGDRQALLEDYRSFNVKVIETEMGIKLQLTDAPSTAFVDKKIIRGISEHLFAVLRDVMYLSRSIEPSKKSEDFSQNITNTVFRILRNANVFQHSDRPKIVVCWGGHSISREEYDYTKKVGYHLGLRGLGVCTGCGAGAMKGPMKGVTIGHAKQRISNDQYLGLTEPGIITAEVPNPIVKAIVILPDIEKRLEAFVRTGHGIVVFPGGVGTAEEILYLLGVLLHPDNKNIPFPLIFTGPECTREYFEKINHFILQTLSQAACDKYEIVIGDSASVAKKMKIGIKEVKKYRIKTKDAAYFNWRLKIDKEFQLPFCPTHENMKNQKIKNGMEPHLLAANLRRVFSGIVAGNIKDQGIREIEKHGYFEINGDYKIMVLMDALLDSFVQQKRMSLPGNEYNPCYRIIQ